MIISKLKLAILITISIISVLCVLSFVNEYSSYKYELRPEKDQWLNFSLMGQFNFISNNISTWSNSWSKLINPNDIIIAVPDCLSHRYPKLSQASYLCYEGDKGFYSPYMNIVRILRKNLMNAILYVHDDMLLTSSLWKKLGKTHWVVATQFWRWYDVIKLYKNGTTSINSKLLDKWPHWKRCNKSFIKIMNDDDILPILHESTNETPYLNVRFGQSDMLYAYFSNVEQKSYFLDILDLFAKHKLFLECALPTAVLMTNEKFGVQIYNAPLCTNWNYGTIRDHPDKMIQSCKKKNHTHEAYHPVKLGINSNWSLYFDKILSM